MKTAVQVRNALARHDLTGAAASVTLRVLECTETGVLHLPTNFAHARGPAAPAVRNVPRTLTEYLDVADRCRPCDQTLGEFLTQSNAGRSLRGLVSAYAYLATARRAMSAGEPLSSARIDELRTGVASAVAKANYMSVLDRPIRQALDQAAALVTEALQSVCAEQVETLLEDVRAELVPAQHRQHAPWDHTPTLIGLVGAPRLTGLADLVARTLQIAAPTGGTLLRGPAYLTSYLDKAVGMNVFAFVTTTPAHSLEHDQLIADLWAPDISGPMAHLPHVADVASTIATRT